MASGRSNVRMARKRVASTHTNPVSAIANSTPVSSAEKQDEPADYLCPICFDLMKEVHMTRCGHSFCYDCIKLSLEDRNVCPKCSTPTTLKNDVFPNFKLNEVVEKYRRMMETHKKRKKSGTVLSAATSVLMSDKDTLNLSNVNTLLDFLQKKKTELEGETHHTQHLILHHFLNKVKLKKDQELQIINAQLEVLNKDLKQVQTSLRDPQPNTSNGMIGIDDGDGDADDIIANGVEDDGSFSGGKLFGKNTSAAFLATSKQRIEHHFDDLEQCYLSARFTSPSEEDNPEALADFRDSLVHFTRYTSLRTLATLNYTSDIYTASSIVSSIEFNRDCDYFAVGGVTRKIKVYDYESVTNSGLGVHHPLTEMLCSSKISSVAWSSYHRSMLASSDYEGHVTLWDVVMSSKMRTFQEHEKRCWCVDFNTVDPKLLASGSDDTKVKLWHSNLENSITSLEGKANICCVKFKPGSRYHLAFGSADHCVHLYDLRNPKQALSIFKGHRKAVSYTKFLNEFEMVSASTDSQLKLWNLNDTSCKKTFKGHLNEKNFVGLATDGNYVACGSETNSLYVYYKGLSNHLLTYKFEGPLEKDRREDDNNADFVSAVCWKADSNVIAAANSQGIVKLLQLV